MGKRTRRRRRAKRPQLVPVQLGLSQRSAASFRHGPRVALRGKPMLRLDRGHAAETRRGHGLTVDIVGDVAGREDAGHAGGGRKRRRRDVAIRLDRKLALEKTGSGLVPMATKTPWVSTSCKAPS